MAVTVEALVSAKNQCSDGSFRFPFVFTQIRRNRGAEDFKRDIADLREGETLRIVSGSANWRVFNEVGDVLSAAHDQKGVTIKAIVGPVLSVDPQNDNALIELAERKNIRLYVDKMPRFHHYRVYGTRKVWEESHHQPLEPFDQRRITYAKGLRVYSGIGHFDRAIKTLKLKRSYHPREDFALLTDDMQGDLSKIAQEKDIDAAWLRALEIKGLLGLGGKFRELSPDRLRLLWRPY